MREDVEVIHLDEAEVYLEDVGPEDTVPILVLHGGPGGSSYALREGFGEDLEAYRVLYLDQRGGGRSPELPAEPQLFTVDALVEDLEQLRNVLGLEQWIVLGHGFGAVLALEYARRRPQQSQGVLLINPWFNFPWLAQQLYKGSLLAKGVPADAIEVDLPDDPDALLIEAFAQVEPKTVFDTLMFPNQHSRMEYEWMVEASQVVGAEGPGQMFVQNGLWKLDYTPYLVQIRSPIAVIVGHADGTSYPEAQAIADITGGSFEAIAGAGHYPWIDEPYSFTEALQSMLSDLENG